MAVISEEELEDYLFEVANTGRNPIDAPGVCLRQVNLKGYGIIDLLYVNVSHEEGPDGSGFHVDITIVELKKNHVDLSALGQICRYRQGMERYLGHFMRKEKEWITSNIYGILVGIDYADGDICYAVDSIRWLQTYTYSLSLEDGAEFKESVGWFNESEDFKGLANIKKDIISRWKKIKEDKN